MILLGHILCYKFSTRGTERRRSGGGKGRGKALKSFKRICVNSSKTSLCDVSQSIGD